MYTHIQVSPQGSTCYIALNRPKALNALNQGIFDELNQAMDEFLADKSLKGAVITGAGEKAFAAGADITELQKLNKEEAEALSKKGQALFFKIEKSIKPVIAAVNGFALGGGCELAMSCHMRVASDNALFGQPEVKLGLLPGYGGTQRLVQYIGRAKATELLITADMIGAEDALRLGLVNYVTDQASLMEKCDAILAKAYKQSPNAIALTLRAIDAGEYAPDGFTFEAERFGEAIISDEAKEGIGAFLEKRKPNF
ncbi:MAG: enoyl-CoA hydratase/isomerase family protein [Bacteroidia bacterium]